MRYLIAALMLAGIAVPATVVAQPAGAEQSPAAAPVPTSALGLETFRLWPGRAPLATGDGVDEVPTLTVFRPHPPANGTAVIVAPGGAYLSLATVMEGREVADWFTSRGITAFVLTYRVGRKAQLPAPLLDGARAVRFVRSNAVRFQINPDRIGMIGFSAGGHLTATTAGKADAGDTRSADPVERASNKLNFVMLGYPWLEATTIDKNGRSQYCTFRQIACDPKQFVQYRPVNGVTANFPPTFIYHTTADQLVRADGPISFYQALFAKQVPVELHVFAKGQHGTGLGRGDSALDHWPELLEEWLRGQGLLTKAR